MYALTVERITGKQQLFPRHRRNGQRLTTRCLPRLHPLRPHRRLPGPACSVCTECVHLRMLRFEWDPKKAAANLRKHGVSFEDAQTVFADENAKLIDDPDHSEEEDRFVLLGLRGCRRNDLRCQSGCEDTRFGQPDPGERSPV